MSTAESAERSAELISLADEERVKEVLVKAVFGLWDVVNDLTRLRPTKRERYRVTIFGSARAAPGTFVYDEVKRVAAALAEMDCDIITGGGPGLMQAANEAPPRRMLARAIGLSAFVWNYPSSRASIHLSLKRSNIKRSSRGCTISCSLQMPSSWRRVASGRCSS